jgi:hypothetical protein
MAIALAAFLCLGATEDDGPILLTNRDVDRLAESDRQQHGSGQLILTLPANEADTAAPKRRETASRGAEPSESTPPSYNGRAGSWQEEYYRLKAIALKRALERGEAIHFGDEAPLEPAPAATARRTNPGAPTCVYHSDGRLIHAPKGIACRPDRNAPASPRTTRAAVTGSGHSTCLYGIRGEVLYTPDGRTCD